MIQFNGPTRQQRRKTECDLAKSGKINPQDVLNKLLYKIIMQNGGTLNFSVTELDGIPPQFAFNIQMKAGQMKVIATKELHKKSSLILPTDKEILKG